MIDIIQYLNNEFDKVGGIDNYIDYNVAQAPDCFDAEEVSDARARLLRLGIGVTEIDRVKVKTMDSLMKNWQYRAFNSDEIVYIIQSARLKPAKEIAHTLKKDVLLIDKIVRKIKELVK